MQLTHNATLSVFVGNVNNATMPSTTTSTSASASLRVPHRISCTCRSRISNMSRLSLQRWLPVLKFYTNSTYSFTYSFKQLCVLSLLLVVCMSTLTEGFFFEHPKGSKLSKRTNTGNRL